jgi:hypothetical protein
MENKLIISNSKDREEVATILFRNGYTVRLGTIVTNGKKVSVIIFEGKDE